jgi:hypothetical protein
MMSIKTGFEVKGEGLQVGVCGMFSVVLRRQGQQNYIVFIYWATIKNYF